MQSQAQANQRIASIQTAQRVFMGGNWIEQPLPNHSFDHVGPFLLIHHWQDVLPGHQSPTEVGVGPHPHRGFSPVTCIYSGALRHQDSTGEDHVVEAGGTQWMNSGSGIVHSERPSDELASRGGLLEMIQFWVNTPRAHKMDPPRYQPLAASETPTWEENEWTVSLVQGSWGGQKSPIESPHPMRIANLKSEIQGAIMEIPLPADWVGILYVLDGSVQIEQSTLMGRQMAILNPGTVETLKLTCSEPARILFLSGAKIHEPIVSHGPFVMNTPGEIQQAILDYHSGKMGELNED